MQSIASSSSDFISESNCVITETNSFNTADSCIIIPQRACKHSQQTLQLMWIPNNCSLERAADFIEHSFSICAFHSLSFSRKRYDWSIKMYCKVIRRASFHIDWKQLFFNSVESNNFKIVRISRKTDTA